MTCDDVRGRLPLFLTADLPPAEAEAVRLHLAGCPGCRADRAELEQVRGLLDAAPPPAVPTVDVGAVYRAALEGQLRSARRWKRAAAAGALVAAGLLLAAVLPKLEVKVGGNELVVRWGPADRPPPAPGPAPPHHEPVDYVLLARLTELEGRTARLAELDRKIREVEDLLLTLGTDVDGRDRQRRDELATLLKRLKAFEAATRDQFKKTEENQTALYHAVFDKPPSAGGNP
jgi:hypothetical protein